MQSGFEIVYEENFQNNSLKNLLQKFLQVLK